MGDICHVIGVRGDIVYDYTRVFIKLGTCYRQCYKGASDAVFVTESG